MNFYPFHIGDYTADTRHLSILEDGAYRRLLDLYYTREAPLPADVGEIQRLVAARDRSERKAVELVLKEFFNLTDDGWTHDRCERELARCSDKRAKARASAAASVKSRRAPASKTLNERTTNAERTLNERTTNAERTLNERTTNAERTLNERTTNAERTLSYQDQDQDQEEAHTPPVSAPPTRAPAETDALLLAQSALGNPGPAPTRHGAIAVLLRSAGVSTHSAHPQVHEWAKAGVTDEQLREAVAMARQRKPAPEQIPVAYLAPIVEDIRAPKAKSAPGWASSDAGIERKARELGIPESRWPDSHAELKAMCRDRERAAA